MMNLKETLKLMGEINLSGNVIPRSWYKHIKMSDGKPDVNGIIILSEIAYWYRPRIERCEMTGKVLSIRARFKADLLQRSYDSFAEQFGFTKRQVTDAVKRLEDSGLVERHFRTIKSGDKLVNNVLFIAINAQKIKEISAIEDELIMLSSEQSALEDLSPFNATPSHVKTEPLSRLNVTPPAFKRETNTESTTENTTEDYIYFAQSAENTKDQKKKPASSEKNNGMPKSLAGLDLSSWEALGEIDAELLKEWAELRKKHKSSVSQVVINRAAKEFAVLVYQHGFTVSQCLEEWIYRGWRGFQADWVLNAALGRGGRNSDQGMGLAADDTSWLHTMADRL